MRNTLLTRLSRREIETFYESGDWKDSTIHQYVQKHAASDPGRVAVRTSHYVYTYSNVMRAVERLATHLAGANLRPGQRVAVWLPNRAEVAVALIACSRLGLVLCPSLHRTQTSEEALGLVETMSAAAFIGQEGYGADSPDSGWFEKVSRSSSIKTVLRVGDPDPELFGELESTAKPPAIDDPDTIVYLAFTSGTTGRPKGVLHSDNTLLANARALAGDWEIDSRSVIYSFSPVSHNLGFGALVMSLMAGSEFVMHDVGRGARVADRLRATAATFVVGVPTHAIDLIAELDAGAHPVTSVKGFRLSGASGSGDVASALMRHGIRPQSGYGMTEAGSHHYTRPSDGIERVTQTSGRACQGFEARVFDQSDPDRPLASREVGHVGLRGASLMLGYFDDQTLTEQAFNADGWFLTGDLGWLDEEGYIRITGRIKDIIIRGGHNIHPGRIEELAMRHPTVTIAAAVGIPDDRLGERVCLVVSSAGERSVDIAALMAHLAREGLSRFDMPEYVAEAEELPLTASGKIRKQVLAELLLNGGLDPQPVEVG